MKTEDIETLLSTAERRGKCRRTVGDRCGELDHRLAACTGTQRRRYYRTSLAVLTAMVLAAGLLNGLLATHTPDRMRCNNDCTLQQVLTEADGVIASCRQDATI